MSMSCGEATIGLLAQYGIDTVFGIPGVHTLDFCSGLGEGSSIQHIQVRNEQGAGFMAEGYARATGKPAVALVISGPGVTNAATAIGQSWADSLPVLLLSAEAASHTIGKGWGVLHEITEQKAVTAPLTALSATAYRPEDVPELLAQAFSIFSSARPRPVHISIPTDIQSAKTNGDWTAVELPMRPHPNPYQVTQAAALIADAQNPLIMVGGGASESAVEIQKLCEQLNAIVISSTSGKGIVPDDHPLSLGGSTVRPEVHRIVPNADVVVAIGTEMSETDSFVERLDIRGKLIRIDLDPRKINDLYPANVGIVADAAPTVAALIDAIKKNPPRNDRRDNEALVTNIRNQIKTKLTPSEQQHCRLLTVLRDCIPRNTILAGDVCQLVYTGAFAMPVYNPRSWFYPAGYCTLGAALPNAIGAMQALPDRPVVALVGDGGFMFTVQELITAAELKLPLPIVLWENGGLKQIRDDMSSGDFPRVGVDGINPDFSLLARSMHCHAEEPTSMTDFQRAIQTALATDRPTVITVCENSKWLL
jgi:thiamine pyrophosphate-dependent acetolactate synthase large subunit-like protein